ncbi:MAG: glycoside hydrolase family 125 protein [Bacteroidota bacterium]
MRRREFILSDWNQSYEKGKAGEGYGSAHYPKGRIWPLGTISRPMTIKDKEEIKFCLNQLVRNHEPTGFIHETYKKDDPLDFTRSWFSWANTYFGELVLKLDKLYPSLL